MPSPWTQSDAKWAALNKYQRAAAMALMEADKSNPQDARNALGAMINRAAKYGVDLGEHVSQPIYQPTIETSQRARLEKILNSGAFHNLTGWAERRSRGEEIDPVSGATHFLAPEKTMLQLTAREPKKYRSWPKWTGYDPKTGEYRGVVMRDASHAFLAPEGGYSANAQVSSTPPSASQAVPPILASGYGRQSGPSGAPGSVKKIIAANSGPGAQSLGPSQLPGSGLGSSGGFSWAPSMKNMGGSIGAFAGSLGSSLGGDTGDAKAMAELEKSAQGANISALSEDERRQQAALQLVASRRRFGRDVG